MIIRNYFFARYLFYLVKILLLFVFYFTTAKLGLSIDAVGGFATLVWLPSGIALAAIYFFGYKVFPGIFFGAFLVNLLTGASPFIALGIGIGNTLEALAGAYLCKRWNLHLSINHLSDALKLMIITPLSAFISATIGVSSLLAGSTISFSMYYLTWQAWWVGDMISILIITPFVFVWSRKFHKTLQLKQIIEIVALALFVFLVGLIAFRGIFGIPIKSSSVTYIVFLPILWATLRFGQRGGTITVLALSIFAIVETIEGFSPFTVGRLSMRLFFLQSFMGIICITSLILAALETERKNLEQRKDEFISVASHELKNPLTSIKAFIQVTQKLLANKNINQANQTLAKVNNQTNKLERLINDLLDVSKIQAGKFDFHKEPISFTDLITETVENMQTITTTHKIFVKHQFNKTPLIVYADKDRMSQVITNLLNNAIKYSPDKKKIVVTLLTKKRAAIVSIKDYGIGMTQYQQEKLFQRYYRAHDNDKKSFPGLGMGLYISNEIIMRHRGKIWVDSKPGKGSTFYFSIPIS